MKKVNKYKSSKISQDMENLNPYSIIHELLQGLNEHLSDSIKSMDKGNLNNAKELAQKAEKIAYSLQNCLDFKEGGEIADNLNYLYRHIRFATKIYIEKDKVDLMQSALFVSNEILEGWKGISSKVA
jgi:flagellar protein FliS